MVGCDEASEGGFVAALGESFMDGNLDEAGGYPDEGEEGEADEEWGGTISLMEEPCGGGEFSKHEGSDEPGDTA